MVNSAVSFLRALTGLFLVLAGHCALSGCDDGAAHDDDDQSSPTDDDNDNDNNDNNDNDDNDLDAEYVADGLQIALASNAEGVIHLAFRRVVNGVLVIQGIRDDEGWEFVTADVVDNLGQMSIDVDENGSAYICPAQPVRDDVPSPAFFLTNRQGEWERIYIQQTIDSYIYPTIRVDTDAVYHITFASAEIPMESDESYLYYRTATPGGNRRYYLGHGQEPVTMDLDGTGIPHIVFTSHWQIAGLYYATAETLDAPELVDLRGEKPVVATNSASHPRILYLVENDDGHGELMLAAKRDGAWAFERVAEAPHAYEFTQYAVAVDSVDCTHAVYSALERDVVVYTNNCDGEWHGTVVARSEHAGETAIAVSTRDEVHIVYSVFGVDDLNDELWYVRIPENLSTADLGTPVDFSTTDEQVPRPKPGLLPEN